MAELVEIRGNDFWVKAVEMLQQNWALLQAEESGAARVYL
jgi:hypothetical protein